MCNVNLEENFFFLKNVVTGVVVLQGRCYLKPYSNLNKILD